MLPFRLRYVDAIMRCKEASWRSGDISVIAKGNKTQLQEYNQSVDHRTRTLTSYIAVGEDVELDIVCRIDGPPIFGYRCDLHIDGIPRGYRNKSWDSRRGKDFSTGPIYLTPAYGLNELDHIQCSTLKSERIRSDDPSSSTIQSSGATLKPGCIEVQVFLQEDSEEPESPFLSGLELAPFDLGQNLKSAQCERVGSKASLCIGFTPSAYKRSIPIDLKRKKFLSEGRTYRPWATFRILYRTMGNFSRLADLLMCG